MDGSNNDDNDHFNLTVFLWLVTLIFHFSSKEEKREINKEAFDFR